MNGNGDGWARLLSAAADRLAVQLEPDVVWTSGAYVCRLVERDTLRIERGGAVVLECRYPGIDIAADLGVGDR